MNIKSINNKLQNNLMLKKIKSLNPFSNFVGRSFKLNLDEKIVIYIKTELLKLKSQNIISNKQLSVIKKLLANNDLWEYSTIISYEIIKNEKVNLDNKIVEFLGSLKIASLFSIYPVNKKSLLNIYAQNSTLLNDVSHHFSKNYSKHFAKKLKQATSNLNLSEIQNIGIRNSDRVKDYFWLKYKKVLSIYSNQLNLIVNNGKQFTELFDTLFNYQILFNESVKFIQNKKANTILKENSYEKISYLVTKHFEKIKNYLERFNIKKSAQILTHISETSNKINLSDLPPLKPSTIVSLILNYLLIIGWALIILFPLFQMIFLSFDGNGQNRLGDSTGFTFSINHYQVLFNDTNFNNWLVNSIIVAGSTMIITVIFTTFLAYTFSRYKFSGKKTSLITVLLLQMVPSIAALTAFLVMFQLLQSSIQISPLIFLIIVYTGGATTGNTFILKGYFDSIPIDLDEAAKIDGASNLKVFRIILVPLAKPMIAIVALWSFIGPFGDVILPILLSDGTANAKKLYTMAAGLQTLIVASPGSREFQYEYLAGAIITAIPITLLFIFAQKFIVGGLTAGAVK